MNELKFNIEMVEMEMVALKAKIQEAMKGLDAICDGQVGGPNFGMWSQGRVSMMCAEMTGLIARQFTLKQALRILEKAGY